MQAVKWKRALVAGAAVLVVGVLLWFVALPLWLRARLTEEARKSGVVLGVRWVRLGWGTAEARDVEASAPAFGATTLRAPLVRVELAGLAPQALTVENARLDVDGDASSISAGAARFRAALPATAPGGETSLGRISVQNARVEWRGFAGPRSSLRVADLSGEATRGPSGWDAWYCLAQDLTGDAPFPFGPWSVRAQHDATQTFVRVALQKRDDGPRLELVLPRDPERLEVRAYVPRSPARSLGLAEGLLLSYGLADADVSIELEEVEDHGNGRGSLRLELWRYRLPQGLAVARRPTDAGVDLAWEGPIEKMPLTRGAGRFGPFSGPMTGWVGRPQGALAFDVTGRSAIMTCAAAMESAARALAGDAVVKSVQDLAALLRAPTEPPVKGNVYVEAHGAHDSRDPGFGKAAVTLVGDCRLDLFP
jgi:hypothetical protein